MNSLPAADSYGHNTWLTTLLLIFIFSQICFSFGFHVTKYWLPIAFRKGNQSNYQFMAPVKHYYVLWFHSCIHIFIHSVISVSQFSHSVVSNSLSSHGLQHTRAPCPLANLGVYSNSCPLSWWCHPTISSSIIPFSSCPQAFPASGSFPMSQFFASGGQSIGVSASASVLPMNIQDWFPLG